MASNCASELECGEGVSECAVVGSEVVLGAGGEWVVSEGTQTGEETDLVQITVPLHQLMQRIESFKALKRHQVDTANRLEFYRAPPTHHENGEGCARTDMTYIRRTPTSSSHIVTQRVQNTSGPTPLPLSPLEQLKQDLSPPVLWQPQNSRVKSGNLLHLPERIATLERLMEINTEGSTSKDLIQRVQSLEMRLLQLESHSPEYSLPQAVPRRGWQSTASGRNTTSTGHTHSYSYS